MKQYFVLALIIGALVAECCVQAFLLRLRLHQVIKVQSIALTLKSMRNSGVTAYFRSFSCRQSFACYYQIIVVSI